MPELSTASVRVYLPAQLRALARVQGEETVQVSRPVTQRCVLDALEAAHPVLLGTIRDRDSARRRPFIRFFAGEADISNQAPDDELPGAVAEGRETFVVVGAMAGG